MIPVPTASTVVGGSRTIFPVGPLPPTHVTARRWRVPAQRPRVPTLAVGRVLRNALLICGLLLINRFGSAGTAVFFGIMGVMIVRSPQAAFLALMLAGLGLATNGVIVPKNALWTVARLAILFVCLARFAIDLSRTRRSLVRQPYFITLIMFSTAAAICSVVSGYFLHIALLKLVSFTVGLTAVLGGVEVLRDRRVDLTPWIMAIAGAIAINGFLILVLGGGYGLVNEGTTDLFFKGPFYHANACGPFCALLGVLLFSTWLFSPYRGRWVCLVLVVPFLYFLWLSKSRTGGAAMVAGLFFVFALTYMPAARRFVRTRLTMSRGVLVGVGAMLALAVFVIDLSTQGAIARGLQGFVYKYGMDEQTTILASRLGPIEFSWRNFLDRPLFGLGFGTSLSEYFVANATLFSAPIEKGFLPTAILEEVGIFGTVPFVVFVFTLAGSLWRRRNAPGLAMLCTFLVCNLGELFIFSFGGWGLFSWMLVAAAILIGDQCLTPRVPLRPVV